MLCSWYKYSIQKIKHEKRDLIVMILMDRMKLISELYLNPKTKQCFGLVIDSSSNKIYLADEVQIFLVNDEKKIKILVAIVSFHVLYVLINLDSD